MFVYPVGAAAAADSFADNITSISKLLSWTSGPEAHQETPGLPAADWDY